MAHQPSPQSEPEYDPESSGSGQFASEPRTSGDLIGQTLDGRYRFDSLLGEGSFARVFKVYDLHRRVYLAAKVLRSDIAHEPMFLERFRREAAVLQRLQHPNIVRYYDIVESDDLVFILTDYIAGRTLQAVLRRHNGPLTLAEALPYLQPLTAALHFAHEEEVVHRDLKPANILLDENSRLYITDFGIAKILSDVSTLTMDTTVGTPHFMSPEQILIGEVTVATDIYALGVLLYQMFTGHLPFTGESQGTTGSTAAMRIVYEHLHLKPIPPRQLNPALSPAVEAVILRCMEKDPAQRYQSVSAIYDDLAAAAGTPAAAPAVPARGTIPVPAAEAERVPTGVGGMSRVVQMDAEEDEEDGEVDWEDKPKREERFSRRRRRIEERSARIEARVEARIDRVEARVEARQARIGQQKAKRDALAQRDLSQMSEKERESAEKDTEKQRESDEKNNEKQREKGWDTGTEKGDFFSEIGPSDRLGQVTWGGAVVWAGIVLTIGLASPLSWILAGAGVMQLLEVAVRLVVPEYRAKPGVRMVFGTGLLALGLGTALGLTNLWPLILIVIGVSMVASRLLE
jgi:serine/threonine protein kinase